MTEPSIALSLWAGWEPLPQGASGDDIAYSFRCTYVPFENQLDIWPMLFRGGAPPKASTDDLVGASEAEGSGWFQTALQRTLSGTCVFGSYGSAIFQTSDDGWGQVWHLSNGHDVIIVRYVMTSPHPLVVVDVQHIVASVHLSYPETTAD